MRPHVDCSLTYSGAHAHLIPMEGTRADVSVDGDAIVLRPITERAIQAN
jgi:hypothetical protein